MAQSLLPFDASVFTPDCRAHRGFCSYHEVPAVAMTPPLGKVYRLAFCEKHAAEYEKRRRGESLDCPFCGTPVLAGEACSTCGVGMPHDAKRARKHTTKSAPYTVRGRAEGNWSGSIDNASRTQER